MQVLLATDLHQPVHHQGEQKLLYRMIPEVLKAAEGQIRQLLAVIQISEMRPIHRRGQ